MLLKDFLNGMDSLVAAYYEDGRDGPSLKWVRRRSRSHRCTSLELQVIKRILETNDKSWFLWARFLRTDPVVLSCPYDVFRQICDWHDAQTGILCQCNLAPNGIVLVRIRLPTGLYTVYIGDYGSTVYFYVLWFDEVEEAWGSASDSGEAKRAIGIRGDRRITLTTLIENGGVISNSLLVLSYCSRSELFSPGQPEWVDVTFRDPQIT